MERIGHGLDMDRRVTWLRFAALGCTWLHLAPHVGKSKFDGFAQRDMFQRVRRERIYPFRKVHKPPGFDES